MPRYSHPYIQFVLPASAPFPHGQTLYRPILVAQITASNGNNLKCLVWPDSGADSCVFPLSFASALQLDVLELKNNITGGVGNTGNITYYADLTIELGNLVGPQANFVPTISFQTFAGFTAGLEAQGCGLLGQSGFFEYHVVTFDHRNRLFHIETV